MLLKKWKNNETWYFQIANLRRLESYTYVVQITLKNPWLIPKYEDNFANVTGLRLYGWLFFYFGKYEYGLMYPTEDINASIMDSNRQHYSVLAKEKIANYKSVKKCLRKARRKHWDISYRKEMLQNGNYNIIVHVSQK